jgi:hypothetical protein
MLLLPEAAAYILSVYMLVSLGGSSMLVMTALLTLNSSLAVILSRRALLILVHSLTPVTKPLEPFALRTMT